MAAISQSRGIVSLGKRFVNQIRPGIVRDPASTPPSLSLRVEKKNGARTVLELRINIPRSKEYACVFPPPSTDSWIRDYVRRKRGVHFSVYDKNLDEQVRPTVIPDELIQPESDKYWAPHPKTGVFGPVNDQNQGTVFVANESVGSVLEEKAFFRPLENLEKPQPHY